MQAGLTPPGQTTASRGSAPSGAVPCPPPSPPGREWKPDPALSFSFPGRIAITEAPCAPARLGTGAHAARSFSKRIPPKRPVLRAKLGVWERRVSERRPRAQRAGFGARTTDSPVAPSLPPVMQVRAWSRTTQRGRGATCPPSLSTTSFPMPILSGFFFCFLNLAGISLGNTFPSIPSRPLTLRLHLTHLQPLTLCLSETLQL